MAETKPLITDEDDYHEEKVMKSISGPAERNAGKV